MVEAIDIAGPGFLNFTLEREAFAGAMAEMLARCEAMGRGERARPLHILLEFVSVNPNGPLHVGHGRYAAYGDSLDRLLTFSGQRHHRVLHQRLRTADGALRPLGRRALRAVVRRGSAGAEDGYQGDVRERYRAAAADEVGDRYVEALEDCRLPGRPSGAGPCRRAAVTEGADGDDDDGPRIFETRPEGRTMAASRRRSPFFRAGAPSSCSRR